MFNNMFFQIIYPSVYTFLEMICIISVSSDNIYESLYNARIISELKSVRECLNTSEEQLSYFHGSEN